MTTLETVLIISVILLLLIINLDRDFPSREQQDLKLQRLFKLTTMPITFSFSYNLPHTNHRLGLPDVFFDVTATMDSDGIVNCPFPQCSDVIDHKRMFIEIYSLAVHGLEQKECRILQGESMLYEWLGQMDKNA